ncbi:MAG: LptA/OstA family protein [Alkalilacustris sp.]
MLRPLAFLACLALMPAPSSAQTQVPFAGLALERDDPIEVVAESLDVDQQAGTALFVGSVVVEQGAMRLAADRLLVVYGQAAETGGNRISRLNAEGSVILTTPEETAEGAAAVYDLDRGEVVMTGDVLLLQGPNVLAGDRLVIDIASGVGRMEGRVRTILQSDGRP